MKSYGRAPTFLAHDRLRTGPLRRGGDSAGDREAAGRVELALPETGVCSGGGLVDTATAQVAGAQVTSGGCCGPLPTAALATPSIGPRDLHGRSMK